jgi:hypothetical protein
MYIGKKSPYADTIEGGTLDNGSETVRTVVGEQAWSGQDQVVPQFIPSSSACGTGGLVDEVGSTEFAFTLGNLRGRGPKICVKTTRTAFKSAYPAAINALKQSMLMVTNRDIRAQYLQYGGGKLIADSTATFAQAFKGDINVLGDPVTPTNSWPNRTPDSGLSHKALEYTMSYMMETLGVPGFAGPDGVEVFKFIGSIDTIQAFKDELNIGEDLRALTTGRYRQGVETIEGYTFEGPYRGIMHGIDPEPLRATTITNGVPTFIPPYVRTQVTKGYASRPNPNWIAATYEVGFLFGAESFRRLVPSYQKVEGWDFSEELVNGGLQFKILKDTDCNFFEDFGQHIYEIERAYQPVMPHAVTAILYKRCAANLGLTDC